MEKNIISWRCIVNNSHFKNIQKSLIDIGGIKLCKVSIIMPLYNAEKYVLQTIESMQNQTFQDFELIIVDDCSNDRSIDIVENIDDSKIRLYKNKNNRGIAYTRNRALSLATGEYIAIMDDDDISPGYRLMDSVCFLDNHPDVDIFAGNTCIIDEFGNDIGMFSPVIRNSDYLKSTLIFQNVFGNSSAMLRRKFIEKNNIHYEDDMCGAEDYKFWTECAKYGKFSATDKIMLYWRKHQNETSNVLKNKIEDRINVMNNIKQELMDYYKFKLEDDEQKLFFKLFAEDGKIENVVEMEKLYFILKKLIYQAYENQIPIANMFKLTCRKQYGKKCSTAFFLWE